MIDTPMKSSSLNITLRFGKSITKMSPTENDNQESGASAVPSSGGIDAPLRVCRQPSVIQTGPTTGLLPFSLRPFLLQPRLAGRTRNSRLLTLLAHFDGAREQFAKS